MWAKEFSEFSKHGLVVTPDDVASGYFKPTPVFTPRDVGYVPGEQAKEREGFQKTSQLRERHEKQKGEAGRGGRGRERERRAVNEKSLKIYI
jgi:hypothetical protein